MQFRRIKGEIQEAATAWEKNGVKTELVEESRYYGIG
jgi:hypothetical protein